jgi:hypothetical protein
MLTQKIVETRQIAVFLVPLDKMLVENTANNKIFPQF